MMNKLNWAGVVGGAFVCALGLLPLPALAAESEFNENDLTEVREVVQQLQARYEKTKDLQADFTQKTMIEGFEQPIKSSGKVYLKKPGRLRWNYLDPSVEDIHVNHDDVKVYVPEHKQVLVGKLTQMSASKAPLELLLGAAKLNESLSRRRGRGVALVGSDYSRSCRSCMKVRRGGRYNGSCSKYFPRPISFERSLSMNLAAMSRGLNSRRFSPIWGSATRFLR
jgi:hypothetical protein